jgi:hypothetical protein
MSYYYNGTLTDSKLYGPKGDIEKLSLMRKSVIISYSVPDSQILIHYNDGLTEYNEIYFMEIGG